MSDRDLIAYLRSLFHPKDEHHRNCSSHSGDECDCYAAQSHKAHIALDEIERRLKGARQ